MDYLYRANDGTIFYDEDECVDYERRLKYDLKAFNGVRLWNEHDKEIPLSDVFANNFDIINIWSVYFPNREVAEQFREMIQDICGEDVFNHDIRDVDKGLYTFNENSDSWVQIEENIKEIAFRVKSLGFTLDYELNFD